MKKNTIICCLLLSCFAAAYMATALADMNGKFSGNLIGSDGNDHPLTYTFKVDGNKLTGDLETQESKVAIDSGKVTENVITFSVAIDGGTFPHKGTYYAQGDSIGMDVNFSGKKAHTTLQRAK